MILNLWKSKVIAVYIGDSEKMPLSDFMWKIIELKLLAFSLI